MSPENHVGAATPAPVATAPFLLEIGVEELPSGAVAAAIEQLKAAFVARLQAERLGVDESLVHTFATPRRLTLFATALPTQQPDAETDVKGPSTKAAFAADGTPTRAAEGFATKNGVAVSDLRIDGDYVVARRREVGQPAAPVLAAMLPDLLKAITFPKFMRWGAGNYRFGRPLRRFVALLGDDIIPFTLEGIRSGRETVGHRYHAGAVTIAAPAAYANTLRGAGVEPDPDARRQQITDAAHRLAAEVGGTAVLPVSLVDENVYLTEQVTGVRGNFDPAYLDLPRPVLETAMKKHQRFFPVEGANGSLLPHFVAIRNGNADHLDTVRAGYEAVLSSRFNDARFFFDHDRVTGLADKAPRMERIVFQEKLGTLADKTARLQQIMDTSHLTTWTHSAAHARRAVLLAKVDLGTEIVAELPALQGVMGREFALRDGESADIADALFEQYLPRFAGDDLPRGRIGTALSLADRVDTLVGYMRFVGAEPKGSSDPFGLKRAATAIVELLARDRALPPLSVLLASAHAAYVAQGLTVAAKPGDLAALIESRLRGALEERGIRYDVADATLAAPWDNIASVIARAQVIAAMSRGIEEIGVTAAATRVRNILRSVKEPVGVTPDTAHLTTIEERTVLGFLQTVTPQVERDLANGEYTDAIDTLAALTNPINRLFDQVMIMADDPAVRAARLSLLAAADRLYLGLADFSRLLAE